MKRDNNNEQKINEILESIDGMQTASPGPFFFTRLQQKLQSAKAGTWELIGSWISRPAIAFSSLILVIILNIAVLSDWGSKDRFDDNGEDYTIASTTIFEYSNPVSE